MKAGSHCATRHREEARIGIRVHVLVVGQAYLRGHEKVGAVSVAVGPKMTPRVPGALVAFGGCSGSAEDAAFS